MSGFSIKILKKKIIHLNSIRPNWLVFIMDLERVICGTETGYMYVYIYNLDEYKSSNGSTVFFEKQMAKSLLYFHKDGNRFVTS